MQNTKIINTKYCIDAIVPKDYSHSPDGLIWYVVIWYGGVWLKGTWINGWWYEGGLTGCIWLNGTWKSGDAVNHNGTWKTINTSPKSHYKPNKTISLNYATYT